MNLGRAIVLIVALSAPAVTQTVEVQARPLSDADVELIRKDVQAQRNQIITDTMTFSTSEAAAFWPIYKEYVAEQHAIGTKRLNLIIDYAQNLEKMDDAKARDLTERFFAISQDTLSLRKKYYPRFEQALGAKRAAKFYQVDNRIELMINLQLTSQIPLIP